MGYNNDTPTYIMYDDRTNGKIVSSLNVTFMECVESNTPSMVDDIDEESKSSYNLEILYNGVHNLKTTGRARIIMLETMKSTRMTR